MPTPDQPGGVATPQASTRPRPTMEWAGASVPWMVIAIGLGVALLVVSTPIGSGDYGQWLMTSRAFAGQLDPAYRSVQDVPPLVPWALGVLRLAVPDPLRALQILDAGLLAILVGAFCLAAAAIFRNRIAGLLAAGFAFVGTDQITGLFAFGGLLQAASLAFTILTVALYAKATDALRRAWVFWTAGSAALALAALSHLATGALALVLGAAIALFLGATRLRGSWRQRARALAPVIACLAAVGAWWVIVLLPGSSPYLSNPASLNYRGPDRLVEALLAYWPTVATLAFGSVTILAGTAVELVRRRPGPFCVVFIWAAVAFGSLGYSLASGAATDYPRFTTLVLAPLIVAAAGGLVAVGRLAGRHLRSTRAPHGTRAGLVAATALIVAATPMAVFGYTTAARGYELTDLDGLRAAAAWIDTHLSPDATVLAPVREGKWLEGLSGRAALFASPVRYSFRPGEWDRSLAADALLRSSATSANEYFALRDAGGAPCDGSAASSLTIGANHGGEYIDLLRLSMGATRLVTGTAPARTLASVSTLSAGKPAITQTSAQTRVETLWEGSRAGQEVAFRQAVVLTSHGSSMEILMTAGPIGSVGGIQLTLSAAAGVAVTEATVDGPEADLTFTQMGRTNPRLRLTIGDGAGSFVVSGGSLLVEGVGPRLRLVLTDLTGSDRSVSGLKLFCPRDLVARYHVAAALLVRDSAYRDRAARLATLGFTHEQDFGAYALLTLPSLP